MSKVNIETLLHDEIETEFNKLSQLTPGSEEHKATLDGLTKLVDRAIDLEKIESDCEDKAAARESEQALEKQKMEEEKKDRMVKNAIGVAGVVLPLIVTIWGTLTSLKFEEEGTITTQVGRTFIQRLFPKK